MISRLDILIKCIILLYREGELENEQVDSSKDLVKTMVDHDMNFFKSGADPRYDSN